MQRSTQEKMGENEMAETNLKVVMKEDTRTSAQQQTAGQAAQGLKFPRYFTRTGVSPYDEV